VANAVYNNSGSHFPLNYPSKGLSARLNALLDKMAELHFAEKILNNEISDLKGLIDKVDVLHKDFRIFTDRYGDKVLKLLKVQRDIKLTNDVLNQLTTNYTRGK